MLVCFYNQRQFENLKRELLTGVSTVETRRERLQDTKSTVIGEEKVHGRNQAVDC